MRAKNNKPFTVAAAALSVMVCGFVALGTLSQAQAEPTALKCLRTWKKAGTADFSQAQKLMLKGPESVQNLSPAEKDIIRNYIIMTEMLKFRCSSFTPPPGKNPRR